MNSLKKENINKTKCVSIWLNQYHSKHEFGL